MSRPKIIVGAHVLCSINGKLLGQVTSFLWTSTTTKKAIYALDLGQPYELAPTITRIIGTLGILRTLGDGGAEGPGITPSVEDVPRERYFTILLTERGSDTVLFRADNCSVQEQSWDIPTRGLVTGTIIFESLTWENETKSVQA